METAKPSHLLRRIVVPLVVTGVLVFMGWALVAAFNLGAATAIAGAVGTLVVYQVPAIASTGRP